MRKKEELQVTNNKTSYTKLAKLTRANNSEISCSYCKYHKNENAKRQPVHGTRKWKKQQF